MCLGSRRLPKAIFLFALLLCCAPVDVAFAQGVAFAPLGFGVPSAPITDAAKQTTYWNGIANKPPQTEALQLEELHQATQLKETVNNRLRNVAPYADNKEVGPAIAEVEKLLHQIDQLKCDSNPSASEIERLSSEIKFAAPKAWRLLVPEAQLQAVSWANVAYATAAPVSAPQAPAPASPRPPAPPEEFAPRQRAAPELATAPTSNFLPCALLKLSVQNLTPVEAVKEADKPIRDRNAKEKAELEVLLEAVQKASAAIQDKLNTPSSQQQLTNYLWALILIIGLLSLASIISVRYFSEEIQKEWVNSGQVIQFVTVMLLLSVILALGLAGILKEETLGTLLGGIGGYVLSQGVGRAVARAVSRAANEMRTTP